MLCEQAKIGENGVLAEYLCKYGFKVKCIRGGGRDSNADSKCGMGWLALLRFFTKQKSPDH